MASSKAPKHDFAPAWLKIPEHGNQKTSGAKSSEHADKTGYYGYSRRRDDMHRAYDFPYGNGVARSHRGFDPVYDERHFNGGHGLRGYGLEEEFYGGGGAGYYSGYPHGPAYHPAVYHEMNGFHHPAARFHPHMSMYPHYPYGAELYNDRYHGGGGGGGGRSRRSSRSDKDSQRTPSKAEKSAGPGDAANAAEKGEKENAQEKSRDSPKLDEDFPSLGGGEAEEEKQDTCKPPAGVWDKNSVDKITNNKHATGKANKQNCTREVKHNTTIYKALVPSKLGSKRGGKEDSGKPSSNATDINSNSPRQAKLAINGQTSTPPMDVLNTRTVTQPRLRSGSKKSDFLKALKHDHDLNSPRGNGKCVQNGVESHAQLVTGFVDLTVGGHENGDVSAGAELLSSSLEAEQRLLREMGWSEDEEQKPITEEEIREIEALQYQINQLKEQKNGLRKPSLAAQPWSPQYTASSLCGDSGSDTDSDSDS